MSASSSASSSAASSYYSYGSGDGSGSASASSSVSDGRARGRNIKKDPAYEFNFADLLPPGPNPDESCHLDRRTQFHVILDVTSSTDNLLIDVTDREGRHALKPVREVLGSFACEVAKDMREIDHTIDVTYFAGPKDSDGHKRTGYMMVEDQTGETLRRQYRHGDVMEGGGGTHLYPALEAVFDKCREQMVEYDNPPIGIAVVVDGTLSDANKQQRKIEKLCTNFFLEIIQKGYTGDTFGISFLVAKPDGLSSKWRNKGKKLTNWQRKGRQAEKFFSDLDDNLQRKIKRRVKSELSSRYHSVDTDFVDHKTLRQAADMGTQAFLNHMFTD